MKKQPITDAVLLEAMRQRLLDEISRRQETNVINNLIGGSSDALPAVRGASGVSQYASPTSSAEDEIDPALYDYFVDITREDLPDINPATGKPAGWKKSVHRYRAEKGKEPPKKRKRSA